MTEKELQQVYWLKKEIASQQKRLCELREMSLVGSPAITGLPLGDGTSDTVAKYATEIACLEGMIKKNLEKCILELEKLEAFISSIEDSEIRLIFRLRHIEGLSWEEIGNELHIHRTSASKKYNEFIQNSHKSHITCAII